MVVVAALAALVATLVAVLIPWLPDSASEEMDRIVFTYWFATIICIGIFALVAAVIIEAVWAFRVQPEDDTDGPPIHGHTGLEIAWTVVPAILVIAIGIVSAVVLSKNADAGPDPLKVQGVRAAVRLALRLRGRRQLGRARAARSIAASSSRMESADVIHSLWIPEMGQKQDVVPGVTTEIVITPTRTGRVHADLHRALRPRPLDDARARPRARAGGVRRLARATAQAGRGRRGRRRGRQAGGSVQELGATTFASAGCGGCHTFSTAGTDSQIGPSLDDLAAAAEKAGDARRRVRPPVDRRSRRRRSRRGTSPA